MWNGLCGLRPAKTLPASSRSSIGPAWHNILFLCIPWERDILCVQPCTNPSATRYHEQNQLCTKIFRADGLRVPSEVSLRSISDRHAYQAFILREYKLELESIGGSVGPLIVSKTSDCQRRHVPSGSQRMRLMSAWMQIWLEISCGNTTAWSVVCTFLHFGLRDFKLSEAISHLSSEDFVSVVPLDCWSSKVLTWPPWMLSNCWLIVCW